MGRQRIARVVVSVADQAADPRGLWTADYDMLARLPGLEALDIVATENVLAAGFHERVHDLASRYRGGMSRSSEHDCLAVHAGSRDAPPRGHWDAPTRWFVSRDREEELAGFRAYVRAPDAEQPRGCRVPATAAVSVPGAICV